jgi:hypothetical protein
VLEAAHIEPHADGGHNSPDNGLLLRADIHTLLDAGLLAIKPESLRVLIHVSLMGTAYEKFMGTTLRVRTDSSTPARKYVRSRYETQIGGYRHEFLPMK